jgi:hypothetical protein
MKGIFPTSRLRAGGFVLVLSVDFTTAIDRSRSAGVIFTPSTRAATPPQLHGSTFLLFL